MKFKFCIGATILSIVALLSSCSHDAENQTQTGQGKIGLEFDNVYGGANLILNSQTNTTSQNENLKISELKYIVSNIVLIKEDGSSYTYPKSKSYFIVNEADQESQELELTDIPAGNYVGVKFGIGVDETQFNQGASGQGDFLTLAQNQGMLWSWSSGYKFIKFEGTFTSASVSNDTSFMVHTGKTGTDYNYKEITLSFPDKALVRTTITPEVHIFADASKIIDGTNKISLTANNSGGMGAMIMGGSDLPLITANLGGMFSVNHVHNN